MSEMNKDIIPAAGRAKTLEIKNVDKFYEGEVHAVKDLSLNVNPGEFLVLVGPSGCGKSTMLRILAGLESLDSGEVWLDGKKLNKVLPKNRDIAMVFQNYALYPTMSVYNNLAFPLKMRGWKRAAIKERVFEVAKQLEIDAYLKRRPGALSGGQRQRVALGRAMVREPALFLMDEPLSNLDAELRVQMRHEIVSLQRKLGITTVYVTHDQVEAMTMGTRIAVMRDGVLQQADAPDLLYSQPRNTFVAGFIGSPPMNLWESSIEEGGCSIGDQRAILPQNMRLESGKTYRFGIRPEDLSLADPEEADFSGAIQTFEQVGRESFVYMDVDGLKTQFVLALPGNFSAEIGDALSVRIRWDKLHVFDHESGMRLSI